MTIEDILETMDYGPAPENASHGQEWIAKHDAKFGQFINGDFTKHHDGFETKNPATSEALGQITQASEADVNKAVTAAHKAQKKWARLSCHKRAEVMYNIARLIQKNARLFAVLETLDNGKPIRESRDVDIPLVARHFYYHAGMAQLMDAELPDVEPLGVCGQIIPWNFPLLMLAWKIAPAIAMGNACVLKPAEYTSLTALLFAENCVEAGLPKGVVNIVTGNGAVGELIVNHKYIDKIAFTGSTEVGRIIRKATAGSGKALTLELGGKSPYIVFDDADIDSAVEGLVDAIWFNQGEVCCAGSRLLVQEGIADVFYTKLRARMDKLRIGDPLDKAIDIGALIDPSQRDMISEMVSKWGSDGLIYQPKTTLPNQGCYYPPTLITGLQSSDMLMQEEIFGPVLCATTFRTPVEAVQLANNTRYGLAASVWSENINLALDVAPKLVSGIVWINATNLFDAAAGFGGVRESGFGREGGWEGLSAYTKAKTHSKALKPASPNSAPKNIEVEDMDSTAKMYIGGKQVRPDSGYSTAIWSRKGKLLGHVGNGAAKDVRGAVEAANMARSWAKTTGHLRAQILYYIAENLTARADEFAERINQMVGGRHGKVEVEASISRLFTYGAWADKYDGQVHSVPIRGISMAMKEPVGVIGVLCPDEAPLLGLISTMAPLIAMGNTCVLAASQVAPLVATDFYQVLETSDVPAGVVNILTGQHEDLAGTMAGHMDVDAVWCFSSSDLSAQIEEGSASNLKRTWVNNARSRDWFGKSGEGREFLAHATQVKNIWVPYGE